jgi:hypothetical protein
MGDKIWRDGVCETVFRDRLAVIAKVQDAVEGLAAR